MGGKSSSSSSSSTQTIDARVAADGDGIAIGQEGSLTINNSFDENVADVAFALIDLAAQNSGKAFDAINTSNALTTEALSRSSDSEATTTIRDILIFGGLTVAAVFVLPPLFKRG